MQGLILLNWKRSNEPLVIEGVNLTKRRDLLPAFMKSVGLFFLPHGDCVMPETTEEIYLDFPSHCSVWEFRGGVDFNLAARRCLEF
jgi:HprK-related kinase B